MNIDEYEYKLNIINNEYESKINIINNEYESKIKSLQKEFAFSNNIVKVNSIIKDHCKIIKVENIKWSKNNISRIPSECVYYGIELKKNLEPKRNNKLQAVIYQSNLKEIIKND